MYLYSYKPPVKREEAEDIATLNQAKSKLVMEKV
jgi:hypothetical protein